MPSLDINLLPKEASLKKEEEKHRQKSIFRFTFLVVFLSAILILVAFVFSFYLKNQADSIKKKSEIERQRIEKARDKETLLFWTKTKILAIQKILSAKPLYASQLASLDLITSLTAEGLALTDYSFSAQNVEFSLLASSSGNVEEFTDKLIAENDRQKIFNNATISTFGLDKDGTYKFSIKATLVK